MDLFGGGYEVELREALEATCEELDLQLLLTYGRMLSPPGDSFAAHNAVYELVRPGLADGLVAISPGLAARTGEKGLARLFASSGIAARVSAGFIVAGTPSVVIDHRAGMEALLSHLLGHHGCRRVAFIAGPSGNPDAEARFEVYQRILERYSVAFDARLVASGDFVRRSGDMAMEELLGRGPPPEAVVVANDGMALGAISALHRHGLHVPDDVLVTGFDDLAMARLGDPPLTTVAQPLAAMMDTAVRMVHAQLSGKPVEAVVRLPAELMVRDSCGCRGASRAKAASSRRERPKDARAFLEDQRDRILCALSPAPRFGKPSPAAHVSALLSALGDELDGQGPRFVGAVKTALSLLGGDHEQRQSLQVTLRQLREELRPILSTPLEDLFHDASAVVALTDARIGVQQRLEIDQAYSLLMEKGEEFSNALDLPGLSQGLCRSLPALGMNTAFISLYPHHDTTRLNALVCLVDGASVTPAQNEFSSQSLIPPGVLSEARRRTWLVLPLVLKTRCIGIAVFEHTPGCNGYVVVRDRISVALGGIELHQAILESTTLHARKIQEQQRLANEDRIRSLNALAGGVAHDLNNSLGPLVALPDVMLEELERLEQRSSEPLGALRSDLSSIKSSGLRAAQTIKDLLALSRQSRAVKEILDLNQSLSNLLADPTQHDSWSNEDVEWKVELQPKPLWISASETHLWRALENLARNALEAMDRQGTLIIRTHERQVDAALARREGVREGRYAVLEVCDTGKGINPTDLGRIFEPFFSSKPLSETSGSGLGLSIVGSVVKDHSGFVHVHSIVGQGTTFTLHFPLESAAPKRRDSKRLLMRGSGRILVVDDDPIQLRTAVRLLEHFGYEATAVNSGARAYSYFSRADDSGKAGPPFDLLILDMLLNEAEDGLELYARIQSVFPEQKAIIISGHAPPERAELAIAEGLSWLPKPYTASALAAAVRDALGSERENATR